METINSLIVKSIKGDLRQGGSLVSATIDGDTDLLAAGDNVRLAGKAFADFDDPIFREYFNGHVLEDPDFSFDAFESQAGVQIGTANYLMTERLQAIGFTEQGSPANDHQIAPTMRISSCFSHIVERHCNFIFNATTMPDGIITETDIDTSDTALALFNVRGGPNFWQALVNQVSGGEEGGVQFYRPFFNRLNKLFSLPAVAFQTSPPASKGTLTKEHLRGKVRAIIRTGKLADMTGQVQLAAVQSANSVLTSKFPALLPTRGRIVVKNSGVFADVQARVDTLAQNLYDWLNRPYTLTIEVDPGLILFGDDGQGLDLGDKVTVTYDGPAEDAITGAGVHLNLSAQDFWVYKYGATFDSQGRMAKGTLELEADN
jgi:hypothetical protein